MKYLIVVAVAACNGGHDVTVDAGDASSADGSAACTATGVEGCACSPVAPNQIVSIAPSQAIAKLVNDPVRCRVYGLADAAVLVFDTKQKIELAPITLASPAIDFDVARDGARMIVAHRSSSATVVDLDQLAVTSTIPLPVEPGRIELTASGQAYYVNFDQFSSVHRLDLASRADSVVADRIAYQADLELSPDDSKLFVGDSASSDSALYELDTTTFAQVGRSHWNQSLDFSNATRHVFVSHTGDVYFAAHQWRGLSLSIVTGGTGEDILAESDDGTIAIGTAHTFDVALAAPAITFGIPVLAATFAAAGQEAWMYDSATIRIANTLDLAGANPLGVRELPPLPLSQYTIDQLLYDPAQSALYGRDSARNSIVVFDATTLLPTREIRVGTAPSDMALDPSGSALYVGHADQQALAQLDRATATFTQFVQTPRLPYEVEAAGAGRVITADERFDSAPTLFDVASGNASPTTQDLDFAALSVSADGATLFAGAGSDLYKFVIGATSLSLISHTSMAFNSQQRLVIAHPLATSVFYAKDAVDAADLTTVRYTTAATVLAVSPDGRVALTRANVIDVATGAVLGSLPIASDVVAVSSTRAYLWTVGQLQSVALDTYHPNERVLSGSGSPCVVSGRAAIH